MKKYFILASCLLFLNVILAENPRFIQAQLSYTTFYSPADGPYIETYLSVIGGSLEWVQNDLGQFQSKLNVTMIFKDGGKIAAFDKYELSSPIISDSTERFITFLDQQRFSLPNGEYDFEITLKDPNADTPPFSANETIIINIPKDAVSISGIQLLESYKKSEEPTVLTKSGYDMIPYIYNFIPKEVNTINVYAEIYNTDKVFGTDQKFLLSHYIQSYETKRTMSSFSHFRREESKPVNVLLVNYNIAELPSGNYNLVIEVRDRENMLVNSQKLFFQRSNPDLKIEQPIYASISIENSFVNKITNQDTLTEYIKFLTPIATEIENRFIRQQIESQNADLQLMQRFFLNFWLERDEANPELAWNTYLAKVNLVNEQFGSPSKKGKRGYQTDMGYVFLKYGPPNTITDRPFDASSSGLTINPGGEETIAMGSVPYQIWHYYSINEYRDRKFVFANHHLALFDYQLIHSNMPGEVQNDNWQSELFYRFNVGGTMPETDKYKGQSGDFYNHPR